MLSLRHCRELVGAHSGSLSDEELAVLREQFYSLAALTIDAATNKGKKTRLRLVDPNAGSLPAPTIRDVLNLMTDDQRDIIEERAAILEYDANLTRDEAERAAIVMLIQRDEN